MLAEISAFCGKRVTVLMQRALHQQAGRPAVLMVPCRTCTTLTGKCMLFGCSITRREVRISLVEEMFRFEERGIASPVGRNGAVGPAWWANEHIG